MYAICNPAILLQDAYPRAEEQSSTQELPRCTNSQIRWGLTQNQKLGSRICFSKLSNESYISWSLENTVLGYLWHSCLGGMNNTVDRGKKTQELHSLVHQPQTKYVNCTIFIACNELHQRKWTNYSYKTQLNESCWHNKQKTKSQKNTLYIHVHNTSIYLLNDVYKYIEVTYT